MATDQAIRDQVRQTDEQIRNWQEVIELLLMDTRAALGLEPLTPAVEEYRASLIQTPEEKADGDAWIRELVAMWAVGLKRIHGGAR